MSQPSTLGRPEDSLAGQVQSGLSGYDPHGVSQMVYIIRASLQSYTMRDKEGSDPPPPSAERRQQLIELADWMERQPQGAVDYSSDLLKKMIRLQADFNDLSSGMSGEFFSSEIVKNGPRWRTQEEYAYEKHSGRKMEQWTAEDRKKAENFEPDDDE